MFDDDNRVWKPSTVFSYPRIGALEVFVKKGRERVEVYSKLKRVKWPNKDWLKDQMKKTIDGNRISGWEAPKKQAKVKKKYSA